MKEVWLKVKGEEHLEVSNKGRVRTITRIINKSIRGAKYKSTIHGYVLNTDIKNKPYCSLVFNKNSYRVHRLVAQAFIPNPENKPFVNHKDLNKKNNNHNNLEWVTRLGNVEHYMDSEKEKFKRVYKKEINTGKVLKEYRCAHRVIKDGYSRQSVRRCCEGKQVSHRGFNWSY